MIISDLDLIAMSLAAVAATRLHVEELSPALSSSTVMASWAVNPEFIRNKR